MSKDTSPERRAGQTDEQSASEPQPGPTSQSDSAIRDDEAEPAAGSTRDDTGPTDESIPHTLVNNNTLENSGKSMGVPIKGDPFDRGNAGFKRYWTEIFKALPDRGDSKTHYVVFSLSDLIDDGAYTADRHKIVKRAQVVTGNASWTNFIGHAAYEKGLYDAAALYHTIEAFGQADKHVYMLNGDIVRLADDIFSGKLWYNRTDPSNEVLAMGTYLGSAHLADRPLNPLEARIFARVVKHAEIEEPDINIKHLGHVTKEDVDDDFPYRNKVYGPEEMGDWTQYAISVEIRSGTGHFVTSNWESLRDDLRTLLMDYHVASMYNEYDHDAFISNANDVIEAEKEIRESEMDIEDRPEGEEYNFQAFHRDVVPVQDQEEAVDGPNDPPEGGDTVEVTAPLSLEAINLYSMLQED